MGQYVLNTKFKKILKDRTKDKFENRVSKKSRLGFPNFGSKADSALDSGKLVLVSRKTGVAFPENGAKVDSTFSSKMTVVSLRFLRVNCIGLLLLFHIFSDVTKK